MADQKGITTQRNLMSGAGAVPSLLLGFALGGFFDGILLHQILQWHHLLSGLDQAHLSLRDQMLFDGLFHAVMYGVLIIGLMGLWRRRRCLRGDEGALLSAALIGFGLWHVLDAILFHWVFGFHRIRPDSANPLLWDLLFMLIGFACIAVGSVRTWRARHSAVCLALFSAGMGVAAFVPWRETDSVAVVFPPDAAGIYIFTAAAAIDARVIGSDPTRGVWMFQLKNSREAWRLYGHGAWFVSGSYGGMGCYTPPERKRSA